ncbi:MAG: ABC transporter permease [Actinobacteria bacterium]|nr:ABC transporter permease [Actinomycetota bacterium]
MRGVFAQTKVELLLTLRRGETLVVTMVLPAALLVFLTIVPLLRTDESEPVNAVLPAAITLAVIATSMVGLGIATGFERSYGVLKRLGGTPLSKGSLLGAKSLSVLAVEFIQVALLISIASMLGARGGIYIYPLLLGVLLGTAAFSGIGMLLAGSLRAEANLAVSNAAFLFLMLLGGILVPVDSLPSPLSAVSSVLPAAPLADLIRTAFDGIPTGQAPLIKMALWAIAAPVAAALTFSWDPN